MDASIPKQVEIRIFPYDLSPLSRFSRTKHFHDIAFLDPC